VPSFLAALYFRRSWHLATARHVAFTVAFGVRADIVVRVENRRE
jgi:hypothetical protein